MVFEEMINRYITIKYNDTDDNLFGMGPKILVAAVGAFSAKWSQETIAHKLRGLTRLGKARTYQPRAIKATQTVANMRQTAAALAASEANVTLIPNPPSTEDLPQTKYEERQFRRSEFYANLFGWTDENGKKQTPALYLIDEMKYAIVSPNPDFDQLKRDLETLSCGKKFLNKSGGASAKWVEYETNWDIAGGGDLVHEAENVFSARKIKAIQETAQQLEDDNDVEDDNNEEGSEVEESEEDEKMDG
ncbi:uncharacterized protein K444DRAFT_634706 [Hyaloscypha bicolor E]|uniref:Uncharacterized protein n=1 Tax=Hyaloscypha bicolor E TaxID=1095630 RepID=A0A2J6SSY2_9HELO|nr:uncharacterized protein K444DRAFT_634706 [Hyaloscypha bicolor E]PMD53894.1 hypothetical protein K444DRAFT_634706 [Hyaloscypha bicolor E]